MKLDSYLMMLFLVYAFLWGAIWGSFLNVLIWRLPTGQSLTKPPSFCPVCRHAIRWHGNVPILGWALLRGRCRDCKTHIPVRYPAVELLVAVLSALVWWQVAWDRPGEPIQVLLVPFMLRFYFMALLVAIAFIDIDHTIIPHELTVPGMILGIVAGLLMPKTGVWVSYFPSVDVVGAAVGLFAGFGIIYLLFYSYALFTGRAGMGGGDATMLGFIGANMGWQSLLFVIFLASLQGVLAAVVLYTLDRLGGRRSGDAGSAFLRGAHHPEFWSVADAAVDPIGGDYLAPALDTPADEPDSPAASDDVAGAPDDVAGAPDDSGITLGDSADLSQEDRAGQAPLEDEGFMKLALPFGPFLALAAIEYFFLGEPIIRWFTAGYYP